jgi:mycoredoxin
MRAESEPEILTVYTTGRCGDCVATKRALDDLGVPYREVRLEDRPEAADFVQRVNDGRRSVPTLAYRGHATSLSRFSPRRLHAFLKGAGVARADGPQPS